MKCIIIFSALMISWGTALITRDGNTADNNRHDGSSLNSAYAYDANLFSGVGYDLTNNDKQFALVSPRHFVCATHFPPSVGGQVRFIGTDGNAYTYTIASLETVQVSGGGTDLTLGTFTTGVDTRVITSVKYVDIESAFTPGNDALTFGKRFLTGNSQLGIFRNPGEFSSSNANIARTRMILTTYTIASGDSNDAYNENGDSGSPLFHTYTSFSDGSTKVGLIGTNSGVGDNATSRFTFVAYLPTYLSQLNTFMSNEGYQMSNTEATTDSTLTVTSNPPALLRQGRAGYTDLTVSNNGGFFLVDGSNLTMTVQNTSTLPTTLTGTDFYAGLVTASSKEAHAVALDRGTANAKTLRLDWSALPVTPTLTFDVVHRVDESTSQTASFTLTLTPGYFTFVNAQTQKGIEDDEDGDAIGNLLEYALGGDPAVTSQTTSEGTSIAPTLSGARTAYQFLRRTDAAARGLTYIVEYSDTLETGSWTTIPLSGASASAADEAGYEQVSLPVTTTATKRFYRLRVNLDE